MSFQRWAIAGLGLLSALTAVLFVLAPVNQDVTTYEWPSAQETESTALPLFPYEPERLDVTFGCADVTTLGEGLLVSTTPERQPGSQPSPPGLTARAEGGSVVVSLGDEELARQPAGADCEWALRSGTDGTRLTVDGTEVGHSRSTAAVNGLFTDLSGETGLRATVVPDTRYETSPSALKLVAGAVSVVSLLAMLVLLHRWEAPRTRHVRVLPRRWWRPTLADGAVAVTLAVWAVIGALTVDDGYIVTMLKSDADTGYVGNYFRWFNAPEAPFGWFYELYRLLLDVSANPWFLRLPSVLLGFVSWLLLDRLLLRRFTSGPRRYLRWASAALFLAWYLPFDVGVRPEPWIVLGSLVVFALVERALATRAFTPLAIGVVVAGATVAVTPTGVAAFMPFLAALPPIIRLARGHWGLVLSTLLATTASALLFMFYDQSLSAVLHATDVRTAIGPSYGVTDELMRYERLFDGTQVEGALNRRVPVLLMLASMLVLAVLLAVRRIPGLTVGPTRRLLVGSALYLVALAFTPTKWTHHFGALAGLGTLVVAVTVYTITRGALRKSWQKSLVMALLAVTVMLALDAPSRWWYLSNLNVKWSMVEPGVRNIDASLIVLVLGLAIAVAGLFGAWRWLRQPGWFVVAVALGTVVVQVGTMAYAMVPRWNTYTMGRANLDSMAGGSCGVEDWLDVEPDVRAGLLPARGEATEQGGFVTNGGFPKGMRPGAPYGTDEAPVWGSGGAKGSLTTGWYSLPDGAEAPDSPPLVVPVGGVGEVTVKLQFADADGTVLPDQEQELELHHEDDEDPDPSWRDARFDPGDAAQVRVVATDNADGEGWIAVGAPRLPKVVPVADVVPVSEPVILDWVDAFVLPCRAPSSVAGGLSEPVRYRFASGPSIRWLAGVSLSHAAGGPHAPLLQLATQTPVPTYLRGDKLFEPVSLFRLDYDLPVRGVSTTTTQRSES
ncbi:arabinosyltransferase domain-containing protein [Prauserella cavernicola]|uniref:Arabinosyltransferase domain-containing protein n=1 Tax=Prauserella cavernicola TaxID=2800127 RepID=A0A934QPS1_9PSEU|nr:arabinosyltransferase domain-containing protein [Prauserella cavernicola]MBK1784370.1 arabinosyltransferase domain-containing protein [Prauserella cavernicola]